MSEKYQELIDKTGARIKEYQENKKVTDLEQANDFNFLDFFDPGENKVSEILAFFFDPHSSHGQGDRILNHFLTFLKLKDLGEFQRIKCEQRTDENRRLDIFIEFTNFTIAVENKIWAYDQHNQIGDYASYLKKTSDNKFLLIYLNPYGLDPGENSISKDDLELLLDEGKIKIMSYKEDLFNFLDSLKGCLRAEKVKYFIEQFKEYLRLKIIGNNSIMATEIKDLIYQNPSEVGVLVRTYNQIINSNIRKVNDVANIIRTEGFVKEPDIELLLEGPFNYEKYRVFKVALLYNGAKLWIQLVQDEIKLEINYYSEKDFNQTLLEQMKNSNLEIVKEVLRPDLSKLLVAEEFRLKIKFVRELILNSALNDSYSKEALPIGD